MPLAPIILFVYNRPWHTKQTLEALAKNELSDKSTLFIYCDGANKNLASKDRIAIEETRRIVKSQAWCQKVKIIERESNYGLAKSIITGVAEVVKDCGKVIVLEDDIVTSKGFLKYMNEALILYANCPEVMQVNGYVYPYSHKISEKIKCETLFLKVMACWGWGTWERAWKHYNHDIDDHYEFFSKNKKLIKLFDVDGNADFFKQLSDNKDGLIDTWAVRWYASWFRQEGYSLFPKQSLVRNIGHDGTGIHSSVNNAFETDVVDHISVERVSISESKDARKAIGLFFGKKITQRHLLDNLYRKFAVRRQDLGLLYGSLDFLSWITIKLFGRYSPILRAALSRDVGWHEIVSSKLNCCIEDMVAIDPPYHLAYCAIGKGSYIVKNSYITYTNMGRFCSIGANFLCGWGIHPTHGISTSPMFYSPLNQNGHTLVKKSKIAERQPITIGNDVFIGANVTVLDGVSIGDGAVIGAGAVVSKDIPAYAIAVGNPIKIIKYRFSQEIIDGLLEIKWWDWEDAKLQVIEQNFFDVDEFVKQYRPH